jgi:Chromo (CHRromatin Organisation MOdifier) domain
MSCLHPVFNVIKLTPALADPIAGHVLKPLPPLKIMNREEEWVVKEILDSKVINQKLQYLVKWEGFGIKHNSWEPWDDVYAPDLVAEFYWRHPGAAHQIRAINFSAIPSHVVPGRHSLEGGVDVRNTHFLLLHLLYISCLLCLFHPLPLHLFILFLNITGSSWTSSQTSSDFDFTYIILPLCLFLFYFLLLLCLTFISRVSFSHSHIVEVAPLADPHLDLLLGVLVIVVYMCQYINLGSPASCCKSDYSCPYSHVVYS